MGIPRTKVHQVASVGEFVRQCEREGADEVTRELRRHLAQGLPLGDRLLVGSHTAEPSNVVELRVNNGDGEVELVAGKVGEANQATTSRRPGTPDPITGDQLATTITSSRCERLAVVFGDGRREHVVGATAFSAIAQTSPIWQFLITCPS